MHTFLVSTTLLHCNLLLLRSRTLIVLRPHNYTVCLFASMNMTTHALLNGRWFVTIAFCGYGEFAVSLLVVDRERSVLF